MSADLLPGFETRRIACGDVHLSVAIGGKGPALVLLHGYPQSKVMWHRLAPTLAEHFTCILPDLRGYGASDKPGAISTPKLYTKRAMAFDIKALLDALAIKKAHVVGHDRGARVAHRFALDHAERVNRLALLDIVPTVDVYGEARDRLARLYFHWFFLIQAEPLPETMLAACPRLWVERFLGGLGDGTRTGGIAAFDPQAVELYVEAFSDPDTIRATCDDYRAGSGLDLKDDAASRAAGQMIEAETLVLWGTRGALPHLHDVLALWRAQARKVTGHAIDSGHFLPEQAPEATLAALLHHLNGAL